MQPASHCLLSLVTALGVCLAAPAQNISKDRLMYELRFADRPEKIGLSDVYVSALAVGMSKDNPVIFFATRLRRLGYDGLWRWDVGKPGSTGFTSAGKAISQLPVVDGACVGRLVTSQDGRILLVCYHSVPAEGSGPPELRKFRNLPPYFEIWDVEGKKLLVTFKSSKDPVVEVQDATLSSDGKTAIIVERFPVKPIAATDPAWDYRVVICDVVTGKRTRTLASLSGPVALSPDSKLLAAHPWKEFDKLLLVDANTGETRVTLAHPAHPKEDRMFPWSPYEFHFAPNGKYLAGRGSLSNYGRGWVVWDLEGKILLGQEYPSQPTTLCFLPEVDRNGREWLSYKDWFRPRPLREERADENVKAITISPDGKLVAVGERGAIRVWSHSLPEAQK